MFDCSIESNLNDKPGVFNEFGFTKSQVTKAVVVSLQIFGLSLEKFETQSAVAFGFGSEPVSSREDHVRVSPYSYKKLLDKQVFLQRCAGSKWCSRSRGKRATNLRSQLSTIE